MFEVFARFPWLIIVLVIAFPSVFGVLSFLAQLTPEQTPNRDPDVPQTVYYDLDASPQDSDEPYSEKITLHGHMEEGRKNGRFAATYETSGARHAEVYFDKGMEVGSWSIWDEGGQLNTQFVYDSYDDNDKFSCAPYYGSVSSRHCSEGLWTEWYESGQKKGEGSFVGYLPYNNPPWGGDYDRVREKVGPWNEWHENGQKKSETIYVGVERHPSPRSGGHRYVEEASKTRFTEWYESGQKKTEESYAMARMDDRTSELRYPRDGHYATWYENGQKKSDHNYLNQHLEGIAIEWREDGGISDQAEYYGGRRVEAEQEEAIDVTEFAAFATRYATAWSSQDPVAFGMFYAENGSLTVNDGKPSVGRDAVVETARAFMAGFPDMVVRLVRLRPKGSRVEFHWHWTGTNTGPNGTGNAVDLRGYEEWVLGEDGLIVQSLGHYDEAEYQRQLNAVTEDN